VANRLCFVCVGLWPRFLCCFAVGFRGETQLWPGDLRVVWLFVVSVLIVVSFGFAHNLYETTVFHAEFLIRLSCLNQFQDRALEPDRPYQKKKSLRFGAGASPSPPGATAFASALAFGFGLGKLSRNEHL
jgi:hypothetical protein